MIQDHSYRNKFNFSAVSMKKIYIYLGTLTQKVSLSDIAHVISFENKNFKMLIIQISPKKLLLL